MLAKASQSSASGSIAYRDDLSGKQPLLENMLSIRRRANTNNSQTGRQPERPLPTIRIDFDDVVFGKLAAGDHGEQEADCSIHSDAEKRDAQIGDRHARRKNPLT